MSRPIPRRRRIPELLEPICDIFGDKRGSAIYGFLFMLACADDDDNGDLPAAVPLSQRKAPTAKHREPNLDDWGPRPILAND